jgi:hypothetical protein
MAHAAPMKAARVEKTPSQPIKTQIGNYPNTTSTAKRVSHKRWRIDANKKGRKPVEKRPSRHGVDIDADSSMPVSPAQ